MSILMVRVVPQGILFGADRNITYSKIKYIDNTTPLKKVTIGQSQSPKVLKWPNKKAIVGYAGAGLIGEIPTDEWLFNFIGDNLEFANFSDLSKKLTTSLQEQCNPENSHDPEALLIHLAGFEEKFAELLPTVWFIRNVYSINQIGNYSDIRNEFQYTEEFWNNLPNPVNSSKQLHSLLESLSTSNNPYGFQQGIDLGSFNSIDLAIRFAVSTIEKYVHPDFSTPQTLQQWEQQMKMTILTYGSFYEVYNEPGERYVGGGADIVSLRWPE